MENVPAIIGLALFCAGCGFGGALLALRKRTITINVIAKHPFELQVKSGESTDVEDAQ